MCNQNFRLKKGKMEKKILGKEQIRQVYKQKSKHFPSCFFCSGEQQLDPFYQQKGKLIHLPKSKKGIIRFYRNQKTGDITRGLRVEEKMGTLRNFIGEQYFSLCSSHPEEMGRLFPFPNYGNKNNKNEEGAKRKIYPREFKSFFLEIMRGYAPDGKGGYVKMKKKITPFWIPSSKPCKISDKGISIGESVAHSTNVKGKKKKWQKINEIDEFCLHVWNRKDDGIMSKKKNILMTYSDIENCTFKPHLTVYKEGGLVQKKEEEVDPHEYGNKLGKNFEHSYPFVYKSGLYNKAFYFYMNEKYNDALNRIKQGFNLESLRRYFHPNYKLFCQRREEKIERKKKEAEAKGKVQLVADEEEQKKRPEEDFKNKKLLPLLREAFTLLTKIEKKIEDREDHIIIYIGDVHSGRSFNKQQEVKNIHNVLFRC